MWKWCFDITENFGGKEKGGIYPWEVCFKRKRKGEKKEERGDWILLPVVRKYLAIGRIGFKICGGLLIVKNTMYGVISLFFFLG